MDDISKTLTIILAAIGVITIFAAPFLFFHGRKFFAQVGQVVEPLEFEKRWISWSDGQNKKLKELSHEIRDAVNVEIGRIGTTTELHYSRLMGEIGGVREEIRETLKKAESAVEKANEAKYLADLAAERVAANKELVVARLGHIEEMVDLLARNQRSNGL